MRCERARGVQRFLTPASHRHHTHIHTQTQEALQAHKAAVELQPENGAVLTNAGWAYEQVGDYEQALALYQRAVAVEPNHSQIASNLANLQQRLQQATS